MKERAIISRIWVTMPNESVYFQAKLPRDTHHICGIETSVRLKSKDAFGRVPIVNRYSQTSTSSFSRPRMYTNMYFGDLLLQSCEKGNIFFRSEIIEKDNNLGFLDFSANKFFQIQEWVHGFKREEVVVNVSGETTIVQGFYRDKTEKLLESELGYEVSIIIWVKSYEKTLREA